MVAPGVARAPRGRDLLYSDAENDALLLAGVVHPWVGRKGENWNEKQTEPLQYFKNNQAPPPQTNKTRARAPSHNTQSHNPSHAAKHSAGRRRPRHALLPAGRDALRRHRCSFAY